MVLRNSLSVRIVLLWSVLAAMVLISHLHSALYASKRNDHRSQAPEQNETAVASVDLGVYFIAHTHTIWFFFNFCMGKKSLIFYLLQLNPILCSSRKSALLTSFSTVQSVSSEPLYCKHRLTVTLGIANMSFSRSKGLFVLHITCVN